MIRNSGLRGDLSRMRRSRLSALLNRPSPTRLGDQPINRGVPESCESTRSGRGCTSSTRLRFRRINKMAMMPLSISQSPTNPQSRMLIAISPTPDSLEFTSVVLVVNSWCSECFLIRANSWRNLGDEKGCSLSTKESENSRAGPPRPVRSAETALRAGRQNLF